jgi:hypothetical protein
MGESGTFFDAGSTMFSTSLCGAKGAVAKPELAHLA